MRFQRKGDLIKSTFLVDTHTILYTILCLVRRIKNPFGKLFEKKKGMKMLKMLLVYTDLL